MPKFPHGKTMIIDRFQRKLDQIERSWPMIGSYERIDPYIVPHMQGGKYFELLIYHIESKLWFDTTHFDDLTNKMVNHKMINEGDVAFDLGSNAGAVTVVMAMLAGPSGHVHAFDPYPWNAAATQCNAELNYFQNVTAHPVGISSKDYQIQVAPTDSRIYESANSANSQELTIHSIRRYMFLRPKFLKLDIEGAEYDLFGGIDPSVLSSVEQFACEYHPVWIRPRGLDPKQGLLQMRQAGFSLHYHDVNAPEYNIDHFEDGHIMFWGKRLPEEALAKSA